MSETTAYAALREAETLLGEAAHRLRIARSAARDAEAEYLAARTNYGAAVRAVKAEAAANV